MKTFSEQMQEKAADIIAMIETYLPSEEGPQKTLFEAMNYSMRAGGKKLRPMLMRETFQMFGGEGKVVEPFMAAMEMIHTHSLIHDDLPAMDNDEYRRGRKTTHVVYGEAMAILAGDALLNYAYETAGKAFELAPGNANVGRAFQILSGCTGVNGMIGGQSVDVEFEGQPLTKEQLLFIYKLKTGALIEGSMMIGAVLAGADAQEIEKIKAIAGYVGLAFQIQDDILDVTSTLETLGKPTGSDEKNNKTTYVTIYSLEQAQEDVAAYSRQAIQLLDELPYKNEYLRELILALVSRKA